MAVFEDGKHPLTTNQQLYIETQNQRLPSRSLESAPIRRLSNNPQRLYADSEGTTFGDPGITGTVHFAGGAGLTPINVGRGPGVLPDPSLPTFRAPVFDYQRQLFPAASTSTNGLKKETPVYGSLASKIASNDRHKLSEKHRRDGQYAYTLAANILSTGLEPGLLTRCPVCIADSESVNVSFMASFGSDNGTTSASESGPAPKKTKNDMLEDNLKVLFNVLLHVWPGQLAKRLDELRAEAAQIARERDFGLRNDFGKSNKWHADVRASVYEQLLSSMEMQCQRHGIDPWAIEHADATMSPMSPPNSPTSSSTLSRTRSSTGKKRSREGTRDSIDEDRRSRQSVSTGRTL
jgi:hypothetical protein